MKIYNVIFGISLVAFILTSALLTYVNSFVHEFNSPNAKYLYILAGLLALEIGTMLFIYFKYMKAE